MAVIDNRDYAKQNIIAGGVEHGAHARYLVFSSRDLPVEGIGEKHKSKKNRQDGFNFRNFIMPEQKRNCRKAAYTEKGDPVCQIDFCQRSVCRLVVKINSQFH